MTFNQWALAHEPAVRLGAFFGVFALMALWEAVAPRRARLLPRRVRWLHNLALVVLNSLILRLLFPLAAVGFALLAAGRGWGLLNATAMFNHANLRLPEPVDRRLRRILVTPEMHRIHHSMERVEANSNFGFNLPWWDRLCGTYRARARLPQESMAIGVKGLTGSDAAVKLTGMLALPFAQAGGGYAIGSAASGSPGRHCRSRRAGIASRIPSWITSAARHAECYIMWTRHIRFAMFRCGFQPRC